MPSANKIIVTFLLFAFSAFAPTTILRSVPQAQFVTAGGPTTLFSENWTGQGDNTALGANWTEVAGGADIVSNKARFANGGSSPAYIVTTTTAHAATADSTVSVTHSTTACDGGPVSRCTDADTTPTMYVVDAFAGACNIYRHDNSGTGTELVTESVTLGANQVVALGTSGTGATVTLKSYYNGILRDTFGDSDALRITGAGRTGIMNWINGGTTDRDWDDFSVTTP